LPERFELGIGEALFWKIFRARCDGKLKQPPHLVFLRSRAVNSHLGSNPNGLLLVSKNIRPPTHLVLAFETLLAAANEVIE